MAIDPTKPVPNTDEEGMRQYLGGKAIRGAELGPGRGRRFKTLKAPPEKPESEEGQDQGLRSLYLYPR
jgi:hypothetical protein